MFEEAFGTMGLWTDNTINWFTLLPWYVKVPIIVAGLYGIWLLTQITFSDSFDEWS